MGSALLSGWLNRGVSPEDIVVVEPNLNGDTQPENIRLVAKANQIPLDFDPTVIVLAIKPQTMAGALGDYAGYPHAVFLSIAAGKPLAFFVRGLPAGTAVVRAMPNTPAAVRQGVTVAVAGDTVTPLQKNVCDTLLAAVGSVLWIADETLMDAVTAVSGSGPAYVFLLVEAMAAAGCAAGLPEDVAMALARQTVIGSGELLRQSIDSPATLRHNVTSPGGTTAAALAVLTAEGGIGALFEEAVEAACRRSRELAD